jgi:methylated-DNA-protein-cysteine methyltransferase related protein
MSRAENCGSNLACVEESLMSWDRVYNFIQKIPRGHVTTYGQVARFLHLPGGARAVGYALAATPNGRGIPWHRVVGAGGRIRVPEPYAIKQRRLLESEGVSLDGGMINMKRFGWPSSASSRAKKLKPGPRRRRKTRFARASGM